MSNRKLAIVCVIVAALGQHPDVLATADSKQDAILQKIEAVKTKRQAATARSEAILDSRQASQPTRCKKPRGSLGTERRADMEREYNRCKIGVSAQKLQER